MEVIENSNKTLIAILRSMSVCIEGIAYDIIRGLHHTRPYFEPMPIPKDITLHPITIQWLFPHYL